MSIIKSVKGRQVFDSRGNPTVEAEIILQNGITGDQLFHQELQLVVMRLTN